MHIRTIIYSTIIGILLSGCASVQKDWDIAKSTNNREAYIEFIEKYPNSRFADEAKDAIRELYWRDTRSADKLTAYENFLEMYSIADLNDQDYRSLEGINELRDWINTLSTDSISNYEAFLDKYLNTVFAAEALSRLESLCLERDWKYAQDLNIPIAYHYFSKAYVNSPLFETVRRDLELIDEKDWEYAKTVNSAEAYEAYMQYHPNSVHNEEINGHLEDVNNPELEELRSFTIPPEGKTLSIFIRVIETEEEPYIILKGPGAKYQRIDTEGTVTDCEYGVDLPLLKYMKPFEAIILFVSKESLERERIPFGIYYREHSIFSLLSEATGIKESELNIVFLRSPTSKSGNEMIREIYLSNLKTIDELIEELNSDNSANKIAAARLLGLINSARSREPLISLLNDSDSEVRMSALHALIRMEDKALEDLNFASHSENQYKGRLSDLELHIIALSQNAYKIKGIRDAIEARERVVSIVEKNKETAIKAAIALAQAKTARIIMSFNGNARNPIAISSVRSNLEDAGLVIVEDDADTADIFVNIKVKAKALSAGYVPEYKRFTHDPEDIRKYYTGAEISGVISVGTIKNKVSIDFTGKEPTTGSIRWDRDSKTAFGAPSGEALKKSMFYEKLHYLLSIRNGNENDSYNWTVYGNTANDH